MDVKGKTYQKFMFDNQPSCFDLNFKGDVLVVGFSNGEIAIKNPHETEEEKAKMKKEEKQNQVFKNNSFNQKEQAQSQDNESESEFKYYQVSETYITQILFVQD